MGTPDASRNLSLSMAANSRTSVETFQLGPFIVPRVWTGLWQLSSSAWGSPSVSQIRQGMKRHVERGYTSFGKFETQVSSVSQLIVTEQTWCVIFPSSGRLLTALYYRVLMFSLRAFIRSLARSGPLWKR